MKINFTDFIKYFDNDSYVRKIWKYNFDYKQGHYFNYLALVSKYFPRLYLTAMYEWNLSEEWIS